MRTRRDMFAFTAGAVVAKTVIPMASAVEVLGTVPITPPSSDADLIRLCAEADVLTVKCDAAWDIVAELHHADPRVKAADAESTRYGDAAFDLRTRALGMPAHTAEGLRAKAKFVLSDLDCSGIASEMALSLARDIMGRVPA